MFEIKNTPWLPPDAITFLDEYLKPDMTVIETGAGGSTIWLAKRVDTVITFEHDPMWKELVLRQLKQKCLDHIVTIWLDCEYPNDGIEPINNIVFDLALIDGRGRVKSIETIKDHIKPGGIIMLDNSERERYKPACDLLDGLGWERTDFIGEWQATAWRKPESIKIN